MAAVGLFSIIVSLVALAAFFAGGLVLTVFLWREMELADARSDSSGA